MTRIHSPCAGRRLAALLIAAAAVPFGAFAQSEVRVVESYDTDHLDRSVLVLGNRSGFMVRCHVRWAVPNAPPLAQTEIYQDISDYGAVRTTASGPNAVFRWSCFKHPQLVQREQEEEARRRADEQRRRGEEQRRQAELERQREAERQRQQARDAELQRQQAADRAAAQRAEQQRQDLIAQQDQLRRQREAAERQAQQEREQMARLQYEAQQRAQAQRQQQQVQRQQQQQAATNAILGLMAQANEIERQREAERAEEAEREERARVEREAQQLALAAEAERRRPYPARPVRIVVGFAPGGGVDTSTRLVARSLSDALGVPVVVENKAGSGGNPAADLVARSQPDGYTLLACGAASHGTNSALYSRLPYDPVRDFTPITMFGTGASVLVVHPSIPARSFAEFSAWTRAEPARAQVASGGHGSAQHLALELLKSMAGIKATHVPYRGSTAALKALLAGDVPAMMMSAAVALPAIQADQLRPIAVTTPRRTPLLPAVPTLAESGLPGYDATTWVGLCAPAGTAPDRVARLHAEVRAALSNAEVQKGLAEAGYEPNAIGPADLSAFIRREIPKWTEVARGAGVRLD